jgi:hypothetical protein
MDTGLLLLLVVLVRALVTLTAQCHQAEMNRAFPMRYLRMTTLERWAWLLEKYDQLMCHSWLVGVLTYGLAIRSALGP